MFLINLMFDSDVICGVRGETSVRFNILTLKQQLIAEQTTETYRGINMQKNFQLLT